MNEIKKISVLSTKVDRKLINFTQNYVKFIQMGFNRASNKNLHFAFNFTASQTSQVRFKRPKKTKRIYRK